MRWIPLILASALLAACSSQPVSDQARASELYQSARDALSRGDYQAAVENYEALESRYPFGVYADQAQVDVIYAYSEMGEPDSAVAAADRFLRLNPRHERAPYAWYMRGVVDQKRGHNTISGLLGIERARRDPQPLERAFDTFRTLIQRFPESKYIADARRRMAEIREELAQHDMAVAKFYREREDWVATANRAKRVVERYPGSAVTADALRLLHEAYRALDLEPLRQDIERVLKLNGIQASVRSARGPS